MKTILLAFGDVIICMCAVHFYTRVTSITRFVFLVPFFVLYVYRPTAYTCNSRLSSWPLVS